MSITQFVVGAAALGTLVVAYVVVAKTSRRLLLPCWVGAPARLAEIVLGIGATIVLSEVAGAVGRFRRASLVGVSVLAAILTAWLSRRHERDSPARPQPAPPPQGRVASAAAGAIALVVACQWSAWSAQGLEKGLVDIDSRSYHMPFAVTFVQRGWVTGLHFAALDPTWSFYPFNSEVVHAVAIATFGTDLLSPLINLGWLATALLAGWCVGRQRGQGPAALAAVAILAATPIMASVDAGSAGNDIVGLALFLAAIAILLEAPADLGALGVAGLSAGLALGTKASFMVPIAGLTVAVLVTSRHHGRRAAARLAFVVPLVVAGSFWYIRNLVAVGNPVPSVRASIGPVHLTSPSFPAVDRFGYRVADYLTSGHFWSSFARPGLRLALGHGWLAIGVLAALGTVGTLGRRRPPLSRALGLVGVLIVAGYVYTPTSAYGPKGAPQLFAANLRYATPAVLLGLVLLTTLSVFEARSRRWWPLGALAVVLLVTEPSSAGFFATWPAGYRLGGVAIGGLLAIAAVVWVRAPNQMTVKLAALGLGVVALGTVVGFRLEHRYEAHRYTFRTLGASRTVDTWARGVHNAHIGVVGYTEQYPLFGVDLSNRVDYVGRRQSHGRFSSVRSCPAFRSAVNKARFDFLVLGSDKWGLEPADEATWLTGEAHANRILHADGVAVYRLRGSLAADGCPRTTSS